MISCSVLLCYAKDLMNKTFSRIGYLRTVIVCFSALSRSMNNSWVSCKIAVKRSPVVGQFHADLGINHNCCCTVFCVQRNERSFGCVINESLCGVLDAETE